MIRNDISKEVITVPKPYDELIKDRIYIGSADAVESVVKNEKIDLIIDLRAEAPNVIFNNTRLHCPIVDDFTQQDASVRKSINTVVNAYNDGKNIYFHCNHGSNRTGAVAVGTLITLSKANTIEEAEEIARNARSNIKLKPEMKAALKRIF